MAYSLNSDIAVQKKIEYQVDDRLLVPLKNHTYTLRLISIANSDTGRKSPFIVKWNHTSLNKNISTDKYETEFVTCATTAYTKVSDPYTTCPSCVAANTIWKKFEETKSNKYRILFDKIKRRFSVFIPVLVVSNSESDAYNGKIKILTLNNRRVYRELCAFLEKSDKGLFFNNFDNPSAKNLILNVSTTSNGEIEYRQFDFSEELSGKKLCAEMTQQWIEKFIKDRIIPLRFDEDFMLPYDHEKSSEFYQKRILPLISDQIETSSAKSESDDIFDDMTQSNPDASSSAETEKNSQISEAEKTEIVESINDEETENKNTTEQSNIMSDQELEDFLSTI